ncbi:hypothetical protein LTR08_002360 [Meristemomyces frigidus]|nr:hypothetical protein LTR08_002360 [Meristemomyces frigidus]
MAGRRPPSVCLACQVRQAVVGRRRPDLVKRRRLATLAVSVVGGAVDGDGAVLSSAVPVLAKDEGHGSNAGATAHFPGVEGPPKRRRVDTQVDGLQEALKSFEELWQQKEQRLKVLRTLSNPLPKIPEHKPHISKSNLLATGLPEANAAPIPHVAFRAKLIAATNGKMVRQVLRAQLLRCETPTDIQRVVACALVQSRATGQHIAALHEPLLRALYRCRNNVDDQAVLDTLSGIQSRFKMYDVPFGDQFLMLGLKFAARARNLRKMKKYLKALRSSGMRMTSNVFRSIIAKFSIGHRGLGEIRNGRWLRSELQQVCTGFDDCAHLPTEQQYHLGCYLDRGDWQYLHGWIAVLARCKDSEAVWREWELWKQNDARVKPKNLASMHNLMTTKLRGDYWFVEQMACSGGIEKAWRILAETELQFTTLKDRIKLKLLEEVQYCTIFESVNGRRVIHQDVRDELLRKYDADVLRMETALGVRWVPSGEGEDDALGCHVLVEDQEVVFQRLGADDWKFEDDFGYPYESSPMAKLEERGLHDAAETTVASVEGAVELR